MTTEDADNQHRGGHNVPRRENKKRKTTDEEQDHDPEAPPSKQMRTIGPSPSAKNRHDSQEQDAMAKLTAVSG